MRFRRGNLNEIFHMHKNYHDPQKIILNTTNYYQIRKSDEIQNIFKTFLNNKTVFVTGMVHRYDGACIRPAAPFRLGLAPHPSLAKTSANP
jgi:hypothetical protein